MDVSTRRQCITAMPEHSRVREIQGSVQREQTKSTIPLDALEMLQNMYIWAVLSDEQMSKG